jgi:hypothetical protein
MEYHVLQASGSSFESIWSIEGKNFSLEQHFLGSCSFFMPYTVGFLRCVGVILLGHLRLF